MVEASRSQPLNREARDRIRLYDIQEARYRGERGRGGAGWDNGHPN